MKNKPANFIPYGRQFIDLEDIRAVLDVLKSDWLTQGPKVVEFEQTLARVCGAKYALAVNNGTAALHLAYLAAGLGKGNEVITTPNTFVATTNMLLAVGAKPVFADIRSDSNNIDETKIEALITPKTKAIVAVDFAGQPCEYKKLQTIATKYRLTLIADACHSLGSTYQGKTVGTLADLSVFSFHAVKTITTGEGGAIVTNNKKLYEKMFLLRSHGITKDKTGFNVMTELGFNYRLTDIQAALGISQLSKLGRLIEGRRKVYDWYHRELNDVTQIILPTELPGVMSAWHIYVIRTVDHKDRLPLYEYLKSRNIGVNFHYPAVYSHPYYRQHGYSRVSLPRAEVYHRSAITLPIFPTLTKAEVKRIARLIKNFFYTHHAS